MQTIIPLVIVSAVFYQLYLYSKAIYIRRMVMLKQVLQYLERDDASDRLKFFAVKAFHDSTSLTFPYSIVSFQKKRKENDPLVREAAKKLDDDTKKDKSSHDAFKELEALVDMMFTINLSFNKLSFVIATLTTLTVNVEKKKVPRDFYIDTTFDKMHMR